MKKIIKPILIILVMMSPSICLSDNDIKQSIDNVENNQQIFGDGNKIEKNNTYNIEEFIVNGLPENKEIPEFDGIYIKTLDSKYIELETKYIYRVQIHRGGDVMDVMNTPKTYYVTDKKGIIHVTKSDFKGIVIRGDYDFKYLSIHPLIERKIQKGEGIFENKGPQMKRSVPIYIAGENMKIRKKPLDDKTYFFFPPGIKKGEYIAWLGKNSWLFEIN